MINSEFGHFVAMKSVKPRSFFSLQNTSLGNPQAFLLILRMVPSVIKTVLDWSEPVSPIDFGVKLVRSVAPNCFGQFSIKLTFFIEPESTGVV
jgi:hypothetical protein